MEIRRDSAIDFYLIWYPYCNSTSWTRIWIYGFSLYNFTRASCDSKLSLSAKYILSDLYIYFLSLFLSTLLSILLFFFKSPFFQENGIHLNFNAHIFEFFTPMEFKLTLNATYITVMRPYRKFFLLVNIYIYLFFQLSLNNKM